MSIAQNTLARPAQQGSVLSALNRAALAIAHRESRHVTARLAEAQLCLEALPLGTADYTLAERRLASALAYAMADEWGAARFEVLLLTRQLNGWQSMPTTEPRRRLARFLPAD